jgi:hypothetical protein
MGVVEVILEVAVVISPHQLITQLPDARLQAGVLLQKLLVALLDVLDDAVLGLHLISALLQMEAHVSARRCDHLKQGAHMLGVACSKCPTRMVGRKLGVADGSHELTPHRVALIPNGKQGNGGVAENWQVVTSSHGKPSSHGRVGGTDGHGTRETPCSRSGAARPEAGWETWDGATRHNGTIRRLQGWRRGSYPSVENKGETNQHFIPRTEATNQNSKITTTTAKR